VVVFRNVSRWLWGVWRLVLGQDETCSDTKYDVAVGGNHEYSRLNSKAKLSKLNSKVSLSDISVGMNK